MTTRFTRVADDNDVPEMPGTYRRVREYWDEHFGPRGETNPFWAELCCPSCGKVSTVGRYHVVHSDGTVSPSYVCPHPPCSYHEFVALDGWDRQSTPAAPRW